MLLGEGQDEERLEVREASLCGNQGRITEAQHSLMTYLLLFSVITDSPSSC